MSDRPDYTSRVPKFLFSGTLEEQERELAQNPLLGRMLESRRRLSRDHHRPVYHYVNPEGLLSDPNGLTQPRTVSP